MKYRNIKNGLVATVIETNDKTGTVTLQYDESGKYTGISKSTLKRWWKKIEEDVAQEPETKEEDVAGDGTPLKEVGKEIAAQAKQKAAAVKKEKEAKKDKAVEAMKKAVKEQKSKGKEKGKSEKKAPKTKLPDNRQQVFDEVLKRIKQVPGVQCRTCAVPYFVAVKLNGKAFMEVRVNKKNYSINLKEDIAKSRKLKYVKYNNYYLSAGIKDLSHDKLDIIDSILKEDK